MLNISFAAQFDKADEINALIDDLGLMLVGIDSF